MDTIELKCPGCAELLEIDIGFAGGICRCSECGTLMTVPADPTREAAETLSRPERPGRPEAPGSPPPEPSAPTQAPAPPPTQEKAKAPTPPSTPKKPILADPVVGETYVTASGKTIKITQKMAVPMARRKRQAVRAGVVLAFILIVGGVVGLTVFAAMSFIKSEQQVGPSPEKVHKTTVQTLGFDPDLNPYQIKSPNVLGLPLADSAVVAIDGSRSAAPWLSLVTAAVLSGFEPAGGHQLQVIIWTESDPKFLPETPSDWSPTRQSELAKFFDDLVAFGAALPERSLVKALEGTPEQLILITGQALDQDQLDALASLFTEEVKTRLDVVLIDESQPALEEFAKSHGGRCVTLPRSRLAQWRAEAP